MSTPENRGSARAFQARFALLNPLIEAGFGIIPLHEPTATRRIFRKGAAVLDKDGKPLVKPIGKAPRDKDWTTRLYEPAKVIRQCIANGWNIGGRIPEGWLVIDIDVRHGGDEGFANLCADFGLDPDAWPCQRTGSGGRHYFLRIPKGRKISVTLKHDDDDPEESDEFNPPRYRGVEFKTIGTQIVAPGSIHPDGGVYQWDCFGDVPDVPGAPDTPAHLLEAITRPEREASAEPGGHISNARLAASLEGLNPEDFRDHDEWLQLMMACHHATGGEGRQEFVEWSTSDPEYADAAEEIGRRWDSLHADRNDGVTVASLNRHLAKAKRNDLLLPERRAAKEFDDRLSEAMKQKDAQDLASDAWGAEFDGGNDEEFVRDDDDRIIPNSQHNVRLAIDKLGASVSYNLFSDRILIEGLKTFGPYLDDAALDRLWLRIDEEFYFRPTRGFFDTVITDYARRKCFHPVREYFDRVQAQWDGTPRLDRFLIKYAGATDSPYTRAISALPLIAAVRRTRQPGAKYDECVVLESPQGFQKSTFLETLAKEKDWFTDSLPINATQKETIEHTAGKLIVEFADLHGLRKGDIDQIKAQLSRRSDRARMAYGKLQIERPRQWVAYGSANNDNYLKDQTGNRRYWPCKIKFCDIASLKRDLDQLWGEAAAREAKGESIRLDPALYDAAKLEQAKRLDTKDDPFRDTLENALGDRNGKIVSDDVWRILGMNVAGQRTQNHNDRMGAVMRFLGWTRQPIKIGGKKKNGFVRGKKPFRQIVVYGQPGDVTIAYAKKDAESD